MNVLIACEFSGIVRDAFIARGHHAVSCDLRPTEQPGPHYQCDVKKAFNYSPFNGWDLVIAHPPCTYLSVAGNAYFDTGKYGIKALRRFGLRKDAMEFVDWFWKLPVGKLCIENPVGYLTHNWRKPTQIIHPYQFGDSHRKATCLWLRGLSPLVATSKMLPPAPIGKTVRRLKDGSKRFANRYFSDTLRKQTDRSRTFVGIALAMAEQWG